jgi:hypothetical protein
MLKLREKNIGYTVSQVCVNEFSVHGVTYFDLLVGEIMYIVEKEPVWYA